MSPPLGQKLKIRAMIYVAGEPIPFFWPMRSFIHHNPLHGLEHLPFHEAVVKGANLFHGRGFLPRRIYQRYLDDGSVNRAELHRLIDSFVKTQPVIDGIHLHEWLMTLLTVIEQPVMMENTMAIDADIGHALSGSPIRPSTTNTVDLIEKLKFQLLKERPVYEAVDLLYGTQIGEDLDELVIKSCLDFFDEGQSAWSMPDREKGFFTAWRQVANSNLKLSLRGLRVGDVLAVDDSPEGVIAHVLQTLQVPEKYWVAYFTRELARLHGWAGFIRWRSDARHYYWSKRFPGDLVDYMAVRLTFAMALLAERSKAPIATNTEAINQAIEQKTEEIYLRYEYYSGHVLPAMAHRVDDALSRDNQSKTVEVFSDYVQGKIRHEVEQQTDRLRKLASRLGKTDLLASLSPNSCLQLIRSLREFEWQENMIWLRAMEAQAMNRIATGVKFTVPETREKRPFVQAMFCIDTRSERIRRHLEAIGDYQTFGIAGFFGVPVSFIELGKGSETHLCPVILTPKNVVLEMTSVAQQDEAALSALEKAMHELKESVLTPFVTVEAIGLLFGFDLVGKTIAPNSYSRWRKRLFQQKPTTRLLLDKLSKEQADSIIRAVQRTVIDKAVEQEFSLEKGKITDALIKALRESAMGNVIDSIDLGEMLGVDNEKVTEFVERLRTAYRINPSFVDVQMERLGRIGFTVDEQAQYVNVALRAIGLTKDFSRFILLVGHGSSSENNPYESALDCGACGGNHGLISARVLAQMANKAEVRKRLVKLGTTIADDAWFVPALHNTTTDEITIFDLDLIPSSHLVYLDRLRSGFTAASRRCAQERLPTLQPYLKDHDDPKLTQREIQRNSLDWSQVRPEWGLSRNAYFIIGRRALTQQLRLDGRAFLHSYDYRIDPKRRLLENILTGPLVVGQWINMEHYFSAVDNERFGSGSKVYHNIAGRFGVMTGNLSDLRTGLPSQTVLQDGLPYHQPIRLITVIEAPFRQAQKAVEAVVAVKHLVRNGWIRLMIVDPETELIKVYDEGDWVNYETIEEVEQGL